MKKFKFVILNLMIPLFALAQRGMDRGRLRPEDYMDYPDYDYSSSNDGSPIIYAILLGAMIIGIIWFKIVLSNSRNKEIREKTVFLAHINFTAFTTYYAVKEKHNNVYKLSDYFVEEDGKVAIPRFAKCIILEYVAEDHSYVKVKFEKYPKPLFVPRWHLRTPDRIND